MESVHILPAGEVNHLCGKTEEIYMEKEKVYSSAERLGTERKLSLVCACREIL